MSIKGLEKRTYACEFRQETGAADGKIQFKGHAAVFNTPTDMGWFIEEIRPGAFTRAIKEDDVRALFNHNPNYVLGRNKAGTLKLSEDATGLVNEIDAPDTQYAKDLEILVKRGDVNQESFAFVPLKEEWDFKSDPAKRTILEAKLYDVSIVTYPAYESTDVSARTLDDAKKKYEAEKAKAAAGETEIRANELELREKELKILEEA